MLAIQLPEYQIIMYVIILKPVGRTSDMLCVMPDIKTNAKIIKL